jgi:hypothetical protein
MMISLKVVELECWLWWCRKPALRVDAAVTFGPCAEVVHRWDQACGHEKWHLLAQLCGLLLSFLKYIQETSQGIVQPRKLQAYLVVICETCCLHVCAHSRDLVG